MTERCAAGHAETKHGCPHCHEYQVRQGNRRAAEQRHRQRMENQHLYGKHTYKRSDCQFCEYDTDFSNRPPRIRDVKEMFRR